MGRLSKRKRGKKKKKYIIAVEQVVYICQKKTMKVKLEVNVRTYQAHVGTHGSRLAAETDYTACHQETKQCTNPKRKKKARNIRKKKREKKKTPEIQLLHDAQCPPAWSLSWARCPLMMLSSKRPSLRRPLRVLPPCRSRVSDRSWSAPWRQ